MKLAAWLLVGAIIFAGVAPANATTRPSHACRSALKLADRVMFVASGFSIDVAAALDRHPDDYGGFRAEYDDLFTKTRTSSSKLAARFFAAEARCRKGR